MAAVMEKPKQMVPNEGAEWIPKGQRTTRAEIDAFLASKGVKPQPEPIRKQETPKSSFPDGPGC